MDVFVCVCVWGGGGGRCGLTFWRLSASIPFECMYMLIAYRQLHHLWQIYCSLSGMLDTISPLIVGQCVITKTNLIHFAKKGLLNGNTITFRKVIWLLLYAHKKGVRAMYCQRQQWPSCGHLPICSSAVTIKLHFRNSPIDILYRWFSVLKRWNKSKYCKPFYSG